MIGPLEARISALVDRDDDSDWGDVQRRVRRLVGRRRPIHPALLVAAAAIALTIAVGPALAIERGLLPWFRDESAPPDVTEELARYSSDFRRTRPFAPDSPLGHLRPSEARGIIAFDTPFGALRMWGVPSGTGDRCAYTEIGGRGRGLFCGRPSAESPMSFGYGPLWQTGYVFFEGRAHADVTWIGIRFTDGSLEAVPFVDGFFVAVVGGDREPAQLLSRRRVRGREIESSVPLRLGDPSRP